MALDIDFAALPELDLERHERALVVEALRRSRSVPEAADLLRVSRFALRRRLEKFGMPTDPYKKPRKEAPQKGRPPGLRSGTTLEAMQAALREHGTVADAAAAIGVSVASFGQSWLRRCRDAGLFQTPGEYLRSSRPAAPTLPPGIRLPPKRKRKAAILSAALALSGCDQGRPAEQPAGGIFITGAEDEASSSSSTSSGSTSSGSSGGDESAGIPPAPLATSGEDASTGDVSSTSSSSTGEASTSGTTGEASTGSTGDASTGGSSGSTGDGSSSTGGEPKTGCPCAPGIDNFCKLPPGTCPPTAPGGYCDPNGDGAYFDGDFTAGWLDWKAECG